MGYTFLMTKKVLTNTCAARMDKNYKPGENYRKELLKKQIEVLGKIGDRCKKIGEIEIGEIIRANPL